MIYKIEPEIITLLVLEDSETARTIYRRYLRSQSDFNCQILEATTLTEGWQIWQQNRPDLVLVDVNLPDGSGLEFLEMMGADYPDRNLPAIVLTARDDEATVMRAMELGAADYLIKENITAIALNISIRNQLRYAAALKREIARSQQQEAAIAEVALRIRQSLDLDEILTCAVREVREVLSVDRAVIYQFNRHNNSGKIVAESVTYPWRSCLDRELEDNCFEDKLALAYREGRIFVANDIYTSNLTPCHLQLLAEFQVRANIAVPILLPNTESAPLWGLLIVHQCSRSRNWQQTNIQLLQRLSVQLAIALQQAELYQSLHHFNAELEQKVADRTQELRFLAQTAELVCHIGTQIRSSLDLQTILDTTVREIRAALQCDRVIIYQLRDDFTGSVVTESILEGGRSVLHSEASDPCITPEWIEPYRQGRIRVVRDIYQEAMTICHQELLLGFDIRAKLMVPIVVEERLWGLMIASHRDRPREWQSTEIEMVRQLSIQVAIAIKQATIYQKAQAEITDRLQVETNIKQLNQQLENRVQQRTAKLRQREEELRHLSDRLELAIKSGAIAIWDWDVVNNILTWDDRMYELYGITGDEFTNVYETWVSRLHPEDRTLGQNAIQQALEGTKDYDLEFRAILPNGQTRYIKAFALVNRNSQGQPQRMVGINYDITQQKQAEATLRSSEAHLRTAQRISKLGSWEYYPKTGQVTWSEETFRIFGLDPKAQELTLETITQTFHPSDRLLHERAFQTAIATASPYNMELRVYRPNGSLAYIMARGEPICNAAGIVTQLVGTVQDVTERKLAEKQLQQARDAAEYANRAKSEFLALMSHEIRTPMNGVLGLTYLALKTNPTPVQREYLSKIQSSAQSLLQIINDILDFSKIEAGKLELESAPFELDEILNNISNILALKAVEKGIELIFNIGKNVPKYLVGDSLRLSQVLINLTGNAVKFTETGSVVVSVETIDPVPPLLRVDNFPFQRGTREDYPAPVPPFQRGARGDYPAKTITLKFMVRDTGIGMNPSQINSLFEAFTQADPSISRKYSGTGLGLAICQRLVKLMGGNIGVESQLNRGSNFYFEIQLGYVSESQVQETIPTPDLREIKSLVVDDNSQVRDVLIHVLESFSFRVTAASSGLEALELLRRSPESDPFELVLIDWCMSDMDGIETSQQIKADPNLAHIPHILMVTAYHRADIWELAAAAGIEAILPKPVDRSRLFESILEVFGHQTANQFRKSKPSVKPEKLSPIRGARILLVEDNEVNQQIAQELLQIVGLNVEVAPNGVVALAKVQGQNYDLILMDIRMPEMNGLEATQRIRSLAQIGNLETERFATVPIIAMTAHAMSADKVKSLEAGMNDHVSKPVNPEELYAVLVKWIAPLGQGSGEVGEPAISRGAGEQRSRGARHQPAISRGAGVQGSRGDEKKFPPTPYTLHPTPMAAESTPAPLLPSLPGLNVNAGLSRMGGDWTVYQRILERFYSIHRESDREIQGALDRQDWSEAFYLVHTLKGSAGNIGADSVFQAAGDLESDLQQATANNSPPINPPIDLDLLAAKSQALARCLQQVRTSISAMISGRDEEGTALKEPEAQGRGDSRFAPTVEKEIDRPQVILLVAEITSLLETDLVEAIARLETLKAQVTGTPFQAKLQAVAECLIEFDTDRAQTLLDEIGKSLEN